MSERQLVVFPRGQLPKEAAQLMYANGFLAVEADDPTKVVTVVPGGPLASANDMFMAALLAVVGGQEGNRFAAELQRRLLLKEQAPGGTP